MIQSLLLDLDDTLLGNSVETFMKGYFSLLSAYARPHFDEATFLPSLIQSTQVMVRNTDPALTNAQVFWQTFEAMTGGKRDELEPFFMRFYEEDFLRLQAHTEMRPAAAELVNMAMERGLSVVVATNPLFPQRAIERRLEWAGLPVNEFDFALVTNYDNMHAAKPQPAYYREVLATIDVRPEHALMVGDDWKNDIAPVAETGLYTYWIAAEDAVPPDPSILHGRGTLDALAEHVANGWLEQLGRPQPSEPFIAGPPLMQNPPPIPELLAELASFYRAMAAIPADEGREWLYRPAAEEWSLTEVACHLRDVELEVHQARIRALIAEDGAFLPGVDADEWAGPRNYRAQDGRAALAGFLAARQETIVLLAALPVEVWDRQGQHTFFGPTSMREIVYLAIQHDRIHAQQIEALDAKSAE